MVDASLAERGLGTAYGTEWARRPWARAVRAAVHGLVAPLVRTVLPIKVVGRRHLPSSRVPVIYAANHPSHADGLVMVAALGRRRSWKLAAAAAADNYFSTLWRCRLSALLAAAVPIERSRIDRRSAELPATLLASGWSLLIFPEGGRSNPDGTPLPFRAGAAWLADRTGAVVVPAWIDGSAEVHRKGTRRVRRHKVTVTFGERLVPGAGVSTRALAERIEAAVLALNPGRSVLESATSGGA